MRPRELEHAFGQPAVAILLDQRQAVGALVADADDQVHEHGLVRLQRDRAAAGRHRVEHRALGVGQRLAAEHRRGTLQVAAAADEAGAVGLVRHRRHVAVAARRVYRHQVEHPRRRILLRARPAIGQQGGQAVDDLGLHEQLAERRMLHVGRGRHQHHLAVAGDLDRARASRGVLDADAAQLDRVLGRDGDLGVGVDAGIAAAELGAAFGEDRLVVGGLAPGGLERRRPVLAGVHVAQVGEAAPFVARRVLAPARDGHVLVAAVAAAGLRHHHVVAAVGQQLHFGRGRQRVGEQAQRRLGGGRHRAWRRRLHRGLRHNRHHVLGHAFVQQHQRGLHAAVGREVVLHARVAQRLLDGQQAHALVMGHERAHHGLGLAARHAHRGVVDGLVEAVFARRTERGQALQVGAGGHRLDDRRHRRGVGGDHELVAQAALEPQARHAEGAVLVVQRGVGGVVAGLRDAPGHAALAAVVDLAAHRGAAGLVQQRLLEVGHDQRRHQVLEHRAAPRHQHRIAVVRRQQPAEREPAFLRQLAAGDRREDAQPGLGGQQVVVAGVEHALVDVVADRHQVAAIVVHEQLLLLAQRVHAACQVLDALEVDARLPDVQRGQHGQRRQRCAGRGVERGRGCVVGQRNGQAAEGRQLVAAGLALRDQRAGPAQRLAGILVGGGGVVAGAVAGKRRLDGRQHLARGGFERVQHGLQRRRRRGHVDARGRDDLVGAIERGQARAGRQAFACQCQQVGDAHAPVRRERRLPVQRQQGHAQRHQLRHQIAAVHGGDVARRQRQQGLRVVPVVEVAAVALELFQRRDGGGDARKHLLQRDEAAVAGRQVGQQREADVGGRRAVGDAGHGVQLHVVGRQVVVLGADEGLEERPGAACDAAQELALRRAQLAARLRQRTVGPPDDQRREEPQQQQGRGRGQRPRTGVGEQGGDQHRGRRAGPQRADVVA